MGLCSKMEDSVDFMHRQGVQDLVWLRDVSMNKSKIRLRIQYASVVERGTIVNFVEGEYIVFGICERQVPDELQRSVSCLRTSHQPACSNGKVHT